MQKHSGRPKLPTDKAKSEVVRARVSAKELAAIEAAAKKAKEKVSDWVRNTLLSAAR